MGSKLNAVTAGQLNQQSGLQRRKKTLGSTIHAGPHLPGDVGNQGHKQLGGEGLHGRLAKLHGRKAHLGKAGEVVHNRVSKGGNSNRMGIRKGNGGLTKGPGGGAQSSSALKLGKPVAIDLEHIHTEPREELEKELVDALKLNRS